MERIDRCPFGFSAPFHWICRCLYTFQQHPQYPQLTQYVSSGFYFDFLD
jgi:hypothetical protein